jgi:hypothetical protein
VFSGEGQVHGKPAGDIVFWRGAPPGKTDGIIHDSRRTTARTKRAAGVAETVICATMGWKPGSMGRKVTAGVATEKGRFDLAVSRSTSQKKKVGATIKLVRGIEAIVPIAGPALVSCLVTKKLGRSRVD